MKRDNSTCAMCTQWTLKHPQADAKQGIGACVRFLNEINTEPQIYRWDSPSCVVFDKAGNVAEREAYVGKMNEREAT